MRWTEKTVHVEKKVAHGNPRVSHDMVCSIDGVSMCLTAHGLLRSLMTCTSVDINILTSLYSASLTMISLNFVTLHACCNL